MENERYVSIAEVKSILEKESASRELTNDQKAALDHAEKIAVLSVEDNQQIIDELRALDFTTDFTRYKIADILPRYPEDVRAIFSKERIILENNHINQIIDIVVKHLK
ncbi:MAG: RNA polymerase Rpb4 family protein [Candidatus Methanomethylophilaceae archaeon]|nr:RNA polymerase Rpb4 family protein [Candidatus Methanomethylophilaceae archaeon]